MSHLPPDLRGYPFSPCSPIALCFMFLCFLPEMFVNGSSRAAGTTPSLLPRTQAMSSLLQAPRKGQSMSAKLTLKLTLSVSLPGQRDNSRDCETGLHSTNGQNPTGQSLSFLSLLLCKKKRTSENSLIFMSLYYFSNLKTI